MYNFEYLPNRGLCKLTCKNFTEIREHFSVKNENAFFIKKINPFISDRFYAMTPTGLFEPGLFYTVVKYIKSKDPTAELKIDDNLSKAIRPGYNTLAYNSLKLELREYQVDAVNKALSFGRGIIKLGTGGGKTLTIASLLTSIYLESKETFKCLLIVPDLTLVNQTYNDFLQYEIPIKITRWTGTIDPDLSANLIIANAGVLQSRYEENKWIFNVSVVVIDECHKLRKGNKICKLVSKIKTNNKFGLTGTLPDNKTDEWNIVGKLGDVFFEKTSYDLKNEKFLTNAEIKIFNIQYKLALFYPSGINKYRHELEYIYTSPFRNNVILTMCKNFNNNTLIMVNHIVHGQELFNVLSKSLPNKEVFFIRGEVEVDARAKVIQIMESQDNVVCVAISAIFSTGVNVKNLHMIIFGSGGKSFIRTIQSIGRGLRLNPNKNKLHIIDLADNLKYSNAHVKKRKEIYLQEKIVFKEIPIVEK